MGSISIENFLDSFMGYQPAAAAIPQLDNGWEKELHRISSSMPVKDIHNILIASLQPFCPDLHLRVISDAGDTAPFILVSTSAFDGGMAEIHVSQSPTTPLAREPFEPPQEILEHHCTRMFFVYVSAHTRDARFVYWDVSGAVTSHTFLLSYPYPLAHFFWRYQHLAMEYIIPPSVVPALPSLVVTPGAEGGSTMTVARMQSFESVDGNTVNVWYLVGSTAETPFGITRSSISRELPHTSICYGVSGPGRVDILNESRPALTVASESSELYQRARVNAYRPHARHPLQKFLDSVQPSSESEVSLGPHIIHLPGCDPKTLTTNPATGYIGFLGGDRQDAGWFSGWGHQIRRSIALYASPIVSYFMDDIQWDRRSSFLGSGDWFW